MLSAHDVTITLSGVQHFSLHDGPGIRTVLFFTGCPLRCNWCCNPECQNPTPQLVYSREWCLGVTTCGRCLTACNEDALCSIAGEAVSPDRDCCTGCGRCVAVCPGGALGFSAESRSLGAVLELLEAERDVISLGGGVTLSGGEPFMYPQGAAALLGALQERGLHTAVETCGFFDLDSVHVRQALAATNLLYYDVKHLDSARHKRGTGVENARILQNLQRIAMEFPSLPLVVRTPVVPGFNDDLMAMRDVAAFVSRIPTVERHELIPYHAFGESKYAQLGRPFPMWRFPGRVPEERLRKFVAMFREAGLPGGVL